MTIILEIAIIMIIRTAKTTTTTTNNTYNGHHHDSDITSERQKKIENTPKNANIKITKLMNLISHITLNRGILFYVILFFASYLFIIFSPGVPFISSFYSTILFLLMKFPNFFRRKQAERKKAKRQGREDI